MHRWFGTERVSFNLKQGKHTWNMFTCHATWGGMLPRSLWWWWILCSYVVNHWVSHDLSPNSPSSRQAFYCDDITVVLASLRGSLPVKTPPAKKPCPGCENPSCFSQWAQLNSARLWKNLPFRSRSAELDGFVWGWWEYWMDRRLSMYYIYIYIHIQYMNYSSKRIPQFWPWSDAAWVPSQLWLSSWPIAKNKSLGLNPWIRPAWPSNFAGPPGLRRMLKSGTRSLDPWSKPSFNRWIANSHRNNDR